MPVGVKYRLNTMPMISGRTAIITNMNIPNQNEAALINMYSVSYKSKSRSMLNVERMPGLKGEKRNLGFTTDHIMNAFTCFL